MSGVGAPASEADYWKRVQFGLHGRVPPADPAQGLPSDVAAAAGVPADPLDALLTQRAASPGPKLVQPPSDPLDNLLTARSQGHGVAAPTQTPPSQDNLSLGDLAKSAWSGVLHGGAAMAGLPGDVLKAGERVTTGVANLVDPRVQKATDLYNQVFDRFNPVLTSEQANQNLAPLGSNYVPKSTLGRYLQTAGSFLPAAIGGEGPIAARVISRAITPAITSETAGELTSGTPYEAPARVAGAILGGVPPISGAGARALGRALSRQLPPEEAALVHSYEQLGGNLRPGQYNPSNFVRQGDSVLADAPFQRIAGFSPNSATRITPEAQADQFNTLLSHTFGEDSPRLTGDVLANASNRIGNQIGTIVGRNSITADPELSQAFANLHSDLQSVRPALDAGDATRIENTLNHLNNLTGKGLDGKIYQSMRQRGGLLQGLSNDSNPTVAAFGQNIRNMLDDAFQRQAPPEDADALLLARQQYRALKTIEPLADRAPTGEIPGGAALLGRVVSEYGSPENAGDLGTLARVSKAYLKPTANSGTSERGLWRSLLTNPLKAAGEVAALPAIGLTGRLLNSSINSPAARARLLGALLRNPAQVQNLLNAPSAAMIPGRQP